MIMVTSTASQPESGFKTLIRRSQLLSMYIILFAIAWPGLIWEALHSQGLAAMRPPVYLSLFIGWAPAIAAIIVTAVITGHAGVRKLLSHFLIWRVGLQWYLVAFSIIAAFILGGVGLHILFDGTSPVIPVAGVPVLKVIGIFLVTVLFGFLINTEEVAWRGFALPRLQAKYSLLTACVLLALPEALLHLPYFWNREIAFFQTVGLFWFMAFSVALVFVYIYIFNKTNGSLLIATIMHASQNAWANLLSDNTLRPFQFTVALMWMTAIALILLTKGQLGYEPEQSS